MDAVFDSVGNATYASSVAALKPRGLLAFYGASSGKPPPLDLYATPGSKRFVRPSLVDFLADGQFARRMADLLDSMSTGKLRASVDRPLGCK